VLSKTRILLAFFTLLSTAAGAQEAAKPPIATVYFMRSSGSIGGLEAFNIFIDDTLACRINNKHYTVHQLPAGSHKLQVRANGHQAKNKIALNILMEAGQTYYVALDVINRSFTGALHLTEVTVNTANKMMPALKQDTNCK
jgi:hypothetical protein